MTNTSNHYHFTGNHSHSISGHTHNVTRGNLPPLDPSTINTYLAKDAAEAAAERQRFTNYLDQKVKAAEKSLAEGLNQTLWGTYAPAITEQINRPSMIATMLEAQERKNMDTNTATLINDEVAKRKAKKARKKVRKAYAAFDGMGLDEADYAVWTWNHTFKGKDTVYEYVALYVNERWYVTGRTGPNGIDTDEFVGWLVSKEFDPETFVNVA